MEASVRGVVISRVHVKLIINRGTPKGKDADPSSGDHTGQLEVDSTDWRMSPHFYVFLHTANYMS